MVKYLCKRLFMIKNSTLKFVFGYLIIINVKH